MIIIIILHEYYKLPPMLNQKTIGKHMSAYIQFCELSRIAITIAGDCSQTLEHEHNGTSLT